MTNIGAFKVESDEEPFIICFADSMASSTVDKADNYQKLFVVGNNIITGTGLGSVLQESAMVLRQSPPSTSRGTAEAILDITGRMGLDENIGMNFVVAGNGQDDLEIYHVDATGRTFSQNKKPDYGNRGFKPVNNSVFDGSGFRHINSYVRGMNDAGKLLDVRDLPDALFVAYEYGTKGARDRGVNDKLQYGLITPKGLSVLYHPQVDLLNQELFHEYIEMMTGVKIPLLNDETLLEGRDEIIQKRNDLSNVLRNTFINVTNDLSDYSLSSRVFTHATEKWARDEVELDYIEGCKLRRAEAKEKVALAANALASRDLEILVEYAGSVRSRQIDAEGRALSYLEE